MTSKRKLLRVMSFNIRLDTPDDGEHRWEYRNEKVINEIIFNQPDIFGLQEVLKHQLDYLVEKLGCFYGYIGVGRDDGKDKGEFVPIFFEKKRFKLIKSGVFWLSQTPQVVGSIGWDARFPRIATWGEFMDLQTNKTLFFFNTHFDHEGRIAQEKSAELLFEEVFEIAANNPVVVTGDFNVEEQSNAYKIITNFLFDARYVSKYGHYGPSITYNAYGKSEYQVKIDYIFVNKHFEVLSHGTVNSSWDSKYSSDHFPLISTLIFKD